MHELRIAIELTLIVILILLTWREIRREREYTRRRRKVTQDLVKTLLARGVVKTIPEQIEALREVYAAMFAEVYAGENPLLWDMQAVQLRMEMQSKLLELIDQLENPSEAYKYL